MSKVHDEGVIVPYIVYEGELARQALSVLNPKLYAAFMEKLQ